MKTGQFQTLLKIGTLSSRENRLAANLCFYLARNLKFALSSEQIAENKFTENTCSKNFFYHFVALSVFFKSLDFKMNLKIH